MRRIVWIGLVLAGVGCSEKPDNAGRIVRGEGTTPTATEPESGPPKPSAAEAAEAKHRTDRAIEAHGGKARLERTRNIVADLKGGQSQDVNGRWVPSAFHTRWRLPHWQRFDVIPEDGTTPPTMIGVTPTGGWIATPGRMLELTPVRFEELVRLGHLNWLVHRLPFDDPSLTLAPLPETTVNEQLLDGVRVYAPDRPTVNLYFDRKSGLLTLARARWREANLEFDLELHYRDHRDFEGVKLPTRIVELRDGRLFTELHSATYQFPPAIDDAVFQKP